MRIHGICEYNGANYGGWQKQLNNNSIQGEIEKVLTKLLNIETTIQGSGRTDAGVHAMNQHFHFEVKKDSVDLDKLLHGLNCLLPSDILVKSLEIVADDWHARFNATRKQYIYKIKECEKDPFSEKLVWLNPEHIDFKKLDEALQLFIGRHNFQNFTSKEEDEKNFEREIFIIELEKKEDTIEISFVGDGFMRYEIRFLVGTAVAYASGQIDLDYIKNHVKPQDFREIVRYKAPSDGLYLAQVFYKNIH